MNTIEMHGFLTGKCLPGDMRVNETAAEYLVRKFIEKDDQLDTVVAERDAAINTERTWETTMMEACGEDGPASVAVVIKSLAAENSAMKDVSNWDFKSGEEAFYRAKSAGCEIDDCIHDAVLMMLEKFETPATDAAVSAIEARGVEKLAESWRTAAELANDDGEFRAAYRLTFYAKRAAKFAAELREHSQEVERG